MRGNMSMSGWTAHPAPAPREAHQEGRHHDPRSVPAGQGVLFPVPLPARSGQDRPGRVPARPGAAVTAADVPALGVRAGDPEGTEFDMWAVAPPCEPWSYVLDDDGIRYRRGPFGWWPFAYAGEAREQSARRYWSAPADCGVACLRLAPDTEYRSWRNEYVLAEPDRTSPQLASARLTLWVRKQGLAGMVVRCRVQLDLRAQAFTIDRAGHDWSAELTAQAETKAAKLLAFLAAARAERDATDGPEVPVTAWDLDQERQRSRPRRGGTGGPL